MENRLLGIYLNDQLAAGVLWRETARRAQRNNSPLSRFSELDLLAYGIEGKKVLWQNLRDLARLGERLPDVDFDELIARAQRQRDEIEPFRLAAGTAALGGAPADGADLRHSSGGARARLLGERTSH